jgi:hypothetical protein
MRSDLTRRREWRWREGVGRDGDPDLFGMASEDEARHLLEPPWERDMAEGAARVLPLVQGGYYLLTGLWPLVHMDSFERVSGRKTDRWLVRTVGALAVAIGSGLLQAGRRGYLPRELRTVSQLAAAGFIAIEVPTAVRGRISLVYLADAALELGFMVANSWAAREQRGGGEALDALVRREAESGAPT